MLQKRVLRAALIASVLLYGSLMPGIAQDAGSGGIGGRPAYPREDNPRSNSIFIHTLNGGESADDGVKVINNTEEKKQVKVYAADGLVASGGAFSCEQEVDTLDADGSWIALSKNSVELEPAGEEIVPFTITVPELADVGEHNGCIVIQEEKPESQTEQGIGLSFRTAIRVAVLVPGDITKQLEITDFKNSLTSDKLTLTPVVQNDGNVSVDADVMTELEYPFGIKLSQIGGRFPVLRGQVAEWNFDHDRPFWGGWVKTSLDVSYDDDPSTFLGDDGGHVTTISYPGEWLFILPHPLAALAYLSVLLLISAGVWWAFKRNRLRSAFRRTWRTYRVKPGEDIKSIAKAHKVSWKTLASANKLKAPYIVSGGQTIKVPPLKHNG